MIYDILDLVITLRCNLHCNNCIKFCNMQDLTGLDYSNSDMTMQQIDNFIIQLKSFNRKEIIETIYITGGEPLLHKNLEEIVSKLELLQKENYFKKLLINSNTIIEPSENIKKYIINFSLPSEKKYIHNVVLLHPKDFGGIEKTYETCTHYRKNRVVLTYQGYSICCAGDAYIRLFDYKDLIFNYLPKSINDFPIKEMTKVCKHCPFSNDTILPFEQHMGCPISEIYAKQILKNKGLL